MSKQTLKRVARRQELIAEGEIAQFDEIVAKVPWASSRVGEEDPLALCHHEEALRETYLQFLVSTGAAVISLAFVVYLVAMVSDSTLTLTLARGSAAILSAFVSRVFYTQSAKTRKRATDLYENYQEEKRNELACAEADRISNARIRSVVQAQIALRLAGITVSVADVLNFSRLATS
jgi:hypothetical protein